ncbi:sensor domain-containing diguanylate cyclase [Variovorax boronicumulans]|uniref:sensor domain-containing diguanylate cyclase n=1 Tax=Variovorax boronicumulans TaxID=436515 RepID=UPI00085CBF75|nr:diguanylate cyclase [Variovorax boronicumulans]OEZ31428.1 diguanylate cyclase [Variovorax boronicumulans]
MKLFATAKRRISLNTRLSVGVAAVVLATTFIIATVALHLVKSRMQASIANEEFARLSAIASAVEQKFASRRILLKTIAESVGSHGITNAAPLQAFLEKHQSLRAAFDNVAFLDTDGELVANLNGARQIGKVNVKDRAYFKDTVAARTGVISEPYRNRLNGLAQVAITEPVLDAAGRVLFVISGSINLKDRNILGELADVRFGQTGYVFITTADGIVIDHPLADRVLKQANMAMADDAPDLDRAIGGFEGTIEGVNHAGVPGLYAFKRIRQADWIMGSMYPRHEAFARIEAIERTAWIGAIVLALLAGALALAVVRQQLRPLTGLHRHMLDAHAAPAQAAVARTYPDDEIGDLSRTFDRLMQQHQASEKFLRDITDNLPAMISHADAQGRYTFVNARLCEELGYSAEELVGQPVQSMSGLHDDPTLEHNLRRVLAGEAVSFERRGAAHRDEEEHFFQTDFIPELDAQGRVCGYYAMTFDITQRKHIELELAHSEAQIRTIADNIPALVSHVDAALYYTFVNAKVRTLHHGQPLVGQWMPAVRGAADFAVVRPHMERALAGETVIVEKAGDAALGIGDRTFKAHYIPDQDAEGMVHGVFAMTFDITDEVNIRRALTQQEKRLRDVTDNIPALVAYFDRDENCLYGNSRARRMAGLDERAPLDGVTLRSAVGEAVYAQHTPHLPTVLAGRATQYPVQVPIDDREAHFQVNLIPDKDLAGHTAGFYLMTFNVTALKEAERKLIELARMDVLTGLPNRLAFNEQLPAAMSRVRRAEGGMALMFLDIDHFKAINDTLGHSTGDGVLAEYARRLRASVRETDTVVRLAGDEFVIVLENVHSQDAVAGVAHKIVSQIAAPAFPVEGRRLDVTTSIGIVFVETVDASVGAGELLARADTALYAAKSQGRNRFAFYR